MIKDSAVLTFITLIYYSAVVRRTE